MEISGKTFLVCGASGALGAEIVKQLREKGASVLGTASTNDSAARIPAGVEVRLLLDYTKPESIKTLTDYLSVFYQCCWPDSATECTCASTG